MDKFSKMLVRISVIFTSIYFVLIAILALVYGENYFNDTYIVLIEYTCYGIFIFDFAILLKYVELKNKRKTMVAKSNNKISKLKADAYDLLKEEVSKLSGLKKILFDTVFSRLLDILSEDCSENDVAQAINSIEKVNSEYVREDDFLNYDGAMRLLGYSSNRVGFSNLMKKHNIKQQVFRNQKVGFKKSEILALKSELEAEQKAKKAKEKPYKQNKAVNKKPRLSNMEKMY